MRFLGCSDEVDWIVSASGVAFIMACVSAYLRIGWSMLQWSGFPINCTVLYPSGGTRSMGLLAPVPSSFINIE